MVIWQADFYRRPLIDAEGNPLWELILVNENGKGVYAFCSQAEATRQWVTEQLQYAIQHSPQRPDRLQVFRPQSVSLLSLACQSLNIALEQTRRTPALKQILQQRAREYPSLPNYTRQPYAPLTLEAPPPVPLPEALWGEQWRFGAIAAGDLEGFVGDRPIPICAVPDALRPMNLKLPSTLAIPGVTIDGGRQSMRLARWLQEAHPDHLAYVPGDPDGLVLHAGLVDRWILTTFVDEEVVAAARTFQQRQQQAQGLHFLLVRPDDSGMTYSGFWLLQHAE